jgi:hypothetical protein
MFYYLAQKKKNQNPADKKNFDTKEKAAFFQATKKTLAKNRDNCF